MNTTVTWIAIALCISQSAMFSGLNLALFSLSRLRLETEVEKGSRAALKILRLRTNSNLLLCTILWGNVSVNVLLAMLSDSVMAGVVAFLFSTIGITFFGEIIPQAYFSRHALRAGALLAPVIRVYQVILYPFAKPAAMLLDKWIGPEGTSFWREEDFEVLLERHIREPLTEISPAEGRGAINFLRLDDLRVSGEGSALDPRTVIPVKLDASNQRQPILPAPGSREAEALIRKLEQTDHTWAILTGPDGMPIYALDADEYLRRTHASRPDVKLLDFCYEPVVVTDPDTPLDRILPSLIVEAESPHDRLLDHEIILYWGEKSRRIITSSDILGRLLHGIVQRTFIST